MNRSTLKALAAFAVAAVYSANGLAQYCQPTCAAPHEPVCAVPPVPCDPSCAAPSGCSTGASNCNTCNTCYQPQNVHAEHHHRGIFGCRPLFNWTKIEIENREKCSQPQAQCCQTAQPTMAMPMMTMQPVQLQMTAYQPVMMAAPQMVAAPQFVQAAPQMVAAPQFVQAAPQMVAAAPQFVQPAPQMVQVASRPQTVSDDDCTDLCGKLKQLKKDVEELKAKMDTQKDVESRVASLEEHSKLHTEILKEVKSYIQSKEGK